MTFHRIKVLSQITIFILISIAARAAEIKVDSLSGGGTGSLPEAVKSANEGDIIVIRAIGIISLESPIQVQKSIRIEGAEGPLQHLISGQNIHKIFLIDPGIDVEIARVGLINGGGGANGKGGAIYSEGNLLLNNVQILNSHIIGSGGAIFQTGGDLKVFGGYFAGNSATINGGAIASMDADVQITSSGFGGIDNTGPVGNSAGGSGGSLYFDGGSNIQEIYSSTITYSDAMTGGGIYLADGNLSAINLTLVENLDENSEISHITAGASTTVLLGNCIIDGESESLPGISGDVILTGPNLSGIFADLGLGNLGDYGGVSQTYPVLPGSDAIDAGNSSLLPNDGRDQRGLARFSDGNGDGNGDTVDLGGFEIQHYQVTALQIRGSATGGANDGGYGNPFDPSDDADSISSADVFVKLSRTGKADIGDAVGANNAAGGGAVSFASNIVPGRIFLKGSRLEIRRNLAIYGPGANLLTVDGDARSSIIRVGEGAKAYLEGLSLENGLADTGAGIIVDSDSHVQLLEVSLAGNAATQSGGGMAILDGGAKVSRSSVVNNVAGNQGGGIFASENTRVEVGNTTISYNQANAGGAIHSDGYISLMSSTLVGNSLPGIWLNGDSDGDLWNSILIHGGEASVELARAGETISQSGYILSDAIEPAIPQQNYNLITQPTVEQLAFNGGTTLSHAPVAPGPAIDAGGQYTLGNKDQPGNDRIASGKLDIGSVEYQNDIPRVIRVEYPATKDCFSMDGTPVKVTAYVADDDQDPLTLNWTVTSGQETSYYTSTIAAGSVMPVKVERDFILPYGASSISLVVSDPYVSSEAYNFSISIVDRTPPGVVVPSTIELPIDENSCTAVADFDITVSDDCTGVASTTITLEGESISSGHAFPIGDNLVIVTVYDNAGNETTDSFLVKVYDNTPPAITAPANTSIPTDAGLCTARVTFDATVTDDCSGVVSVIYTLDGLAITSPHDFPVGNHNVTITAIDGAGNQAENSFLVSVYDNTPPVFSSSPQSFDVQTDPGYCSARISFLSEAFDACSGIASISYTSVNESGISTPITSPHRFEPGLHVVTATATDGAGNTAQASFSVKVSDDFLNCLYNVSWPNAYPLELANEDPNGSTSIGQIQQFLALTDQARWYRFKVNPGSRVTVILSDLPANYDIVVYRDIEAEYQRLLNLFNDPDTQELSLLGVEFAPESFSPESFSPESFSPESFSPESFSPESFSPESFSPESFSPESFSPESFSPESFSPESFSPESFSPESFSPESFSPESFSPESFSPESFSSEFFSPESFSPESFSSAQISSMVAFSAYPGIASEGVAFNTYTSSGYIYVRVRGYNGSYSTDDPFRLSVVVESEICDGVEGAESLGESTLPTPTAGDYKTIILWDSTRTIGDANFENKLGDLADQAGVKGAVVDVSEELRVFNANMQADENPGCPFAKNLVASEIKSIIDKWRESNPNLEYVVIIGDDDEIPFFRTTDEAFLANEANYIPPVRDSTHSQSSLRYGQILTQDPYGAVCELNLVTGPFPYPELAVGRLVESTEDIAQQIDNYIAVNGLLQPSTGLVTGYDFLDDAARAVEFEFSEALNGSVDSLIADSTLAPSEGWTASEMADLLLGSRHDLVFLAGHFSTGSSLAADYETRLTAAQVLDSGADFLNSLIFSIGCHSGYNTVDEDAINGITKQPDWAQTFAKMGATFIAGTGYQYGDTEFVEYSERLYLEFSRQLRTGTGPVSIGKALVNAKRNYLRDTPLMRGIHEKSLVQTTLFGLPMMKMDVPGTRLSEPSIGTELGIIPQDVLPYFTGTNESGEEVVIQGAGNALGLATADVQILPDLADQPEELVLDLVGEEGTVTAKWFQGRDGIVTNPAEPVRPLEIYGVSADNTLLRGIGFRGGEYVDLQDFLPLTGAPTTEIRGVFGNFFSEVFYPVQPWNLNYFGAICGGTDGERLNIYPTQFLAYGGNLLGGVLRKYETMDFRLYYSDNTETFTNDTGHTIIPALAPAPSIAKVTSEESPDGSSVEFAINVLGSPAAGIHEVWVAYTVVDITNPAGVWEPIDLVQDSQDSTLWKGILNLNGFASEDVRFMVQAASGTGLVALSTNFGHYYQVGIDDLAARIETRITLSEPVLPAGSSQPVDGEVFSAAYGTPIQVHAVLEKYNGTSEVWEPLGNSRVGFRVGTSVVRGETNANGDISLVLPLNTRPGDGLLLQAYFQGDKENGPSADSDFINVTKQETTLSFINPPALSEPVLGNQIVVSLKDGLNTPLKERTVFFLVEYDNGIKIGNAVITDFLGRADLSEVFLPPGPATVTAYFNDILLPDGSTVLISDALFEPAEPVSIQVTLDKQILEDSLGFDPQQVDVYYKSLDGKGKNASSPVYENASVAGDVTFNVALQPEDLLAGLENPDFISGYVEATLAGEVIASEAVLLDTRGDNGNHWTTTSQPGQEVSYVGIHWSDAPRFDSALSESPGPRISTTFIGNSFTEFQYKAEPGNTSYTTYFPLAGLEIVVKNGVIRPDLSLGLAEGQYGLDDNVLTFDAKFGLVPGMEFKTVYEPQDGGGEIIVIAQRDVNYLEEGGRMIIRLAALEGTIRPASDATPNIFECRFILGEEDKVQVRSVARIGQGLYAVPWSSEDPGHKQYRP